MGKCGCGLGKPKSKLPTDIFSVKTSKDGRQIREAYPSSFTADYIIKNTKSTFDVCVYSRTWNKAKTKVIKERLIACR